VCQSSKETEKIIQVKELQNLLPNFKIDWLKVINDEFMTNSKISGEDFVLVNNFEALKKFEEFLMLTDKS
jgi:hypothetical protein